MKNPNDLKHGTKVYCFHDGMFLDGEVLELENKCIIRYVKDGSKYWNTTSSEFEKWFSSKKDAIEDAIAKTDYMYQYYLKESHNCIEKSWQQYDKKNELQKMLDEVNNNENV